LQLYNYLDSIVSIESEFLSLFDVDTTERRAMFFKGRGDRKYVNLNDVVSAICNICDDVPA